MIEMRKVIALLWLSMAAAAQTGAIGQKTAGMSPVPGFFPLWLDGKSGKLWLEIPRWNADFLYYPSLPAGVGSNDIGLDRGQLGQERIVRFERHGQKVLLVQPNFRFVASAGNPDEQRSVQDSFAESVLWGFEVTAEEGERVLVDATSFFLRDAHGVVQKLAEAKQGAFRLDASRSVIWEPRTKSFPHNTEVEALLTFTSDAPGDLVRSVTPEPGSLSVRQHHSFVELPGPGFRPRAFDPRSGFYAGTTFADYSAPLGEPITTRYIGRHRLQKKDPAAAVSEPVKPIVYYLDPGTPEPVRSALLDGARWWAQAFEAAGFRNAFRVEMLPAGADPMDIRYNMIQWVHRSTRGWSYGSGVTDPRTGEILKGHVTLGSLRVRQDYLIAEGLLAPYEPGKPVPPEMQKMALARLRQLAAHEVGHTLGLAHNYISSAKDRASVMDYPHPLALAAGTGAPDLSKAYATGIGEWDKVSISWGYGELPSGTDEKAALDGLLSRAYARGLRFITDADSRPSGSAHPHSHLWDNGADPAAELTRVMAVRRQALDRFGEHNIRPGMPMSALEDVLVPLYLGHRYQVEAAAKVLGGLDYNYSLRSDGETVTRMVPADQQKAALTALLKTLEPGALVLPEKLLAVLPPRAFEWDRTRENFQGRTGLTFDAIAPAEAAANLTAGLLLHPERAARLVEYHARDASLPSLDSVLGEVMRATILAQTPDGLAGRVKIAVDTVVLYHLMALAVSPKAPAEVRAISWARLLSLPGQSSAVTSHMRWMREMVDVLKKDPRQIPIPPPLEAPPGQPI